MENNIFQNSNAESETFCNTHDFNHINVDNDVYDLDTYITVDEISLAVKKMKRCQAHGSDYVIE